MDDLVVTSSSPKRILVVDDDGASLLCLQIMLNDEGYMVDTASDVSSGLEVASKHAPDLLLTDIQLPDGNGSELWKQLCTWRPIPAIALSGYNRETIFEKSGTTFTGYLSKPIDFDKLFSLIRQIFAKNQI